MVTASGAVDPLSVRVGGEPICGDTWYNRSTTIDDSTRCVASTDDTTNCVVNSPSAVGVHVIAPVAGDRVILGGLVTTRPDSAGVANRYCSVLPLASAART